MKGGDNHQQDQIQQHHGGNQHQRSSVQDHHRHKTKKINQSRKQIIKVLKLYLRDVTKSQ